MVKTLATVFAILLVCTLGATHANSFTYLGTVSGGQLIYDPGQNLTWYVPPAIYGTTNMSWTGAQNWAAGLTVDGTTAGSWSCPSTSDSWSATGQMGTLFTELGDTTGTPATWTSKGPFTNLAGVGYWTNTQSTMSPGNAWFYYFYSNSQTLGPLTGLPEYTIAVHAGELASVPVPAAILLFAPGLTGLAVVRRRFKK